ncbi:putative oxalyl-CoA decarboxylase [Mycobacterium xenopi 4042]|uniref:Putative oxalyl-CoA decarboxylase n=1 Tax=Mycobacterium xenopi 4042 TaxID=1299334 RepID=X7ZWL0_MYCXE|nr:putative oxalyl-CoA decarboxylase [Mycobacterium xenopi 4042]
MRLLAQAQRPLIVLGKGAAYAQADNEIRQFVESTGIPFLPMSMAKGLLPDSHPQSVGLRVRWRWPRRRDHAGRCPVELAAGPRRAAQWSADATFIQIDIEASEFDSNRPIAAPLAGDIGSVITALLDRVQELPVIAPTAWTDELAERRARNDAAMRQRLADDPHPMQFHNALRAVRDVLVQHPDVYVVNEGANALDTARNVIDMHAPRRRLDSGTWGVMGIGMGYAIAAAVETGQPVVAIEGDSAFGFSAMEFETVCRYRLPITVVVLNNGGVYRGDEASPNGADPAPTVLSAQARHDLIAQAFGGRGYHVTTPTELKAALNEALTSRDPAIVDCQLDPAAGRESGHLTSLNPKSAAAPPA